MPADCYLLAAFITNAVGSCTGGCIHNWLNGLQLWHLFNNAPWHGGEWILPALKKSADKGGVSFKRPPHGPITDEHMRALRGSLDLSTPFGVAAWAVACAVYRGCWHLSELLIHSKAKFSLLHDTCRNTRVSSSVANGRTVHGIHLVWTKTTTTVGRECILTQILGADADLCPVWAFNNHLLINHSPPANTPLFAFCTSTGWTALTKDRFLCHSTDVYKLALLELIFGHSYRIGGSLTLLAAGVTPEIIMKLGGWSLLCFLIYWRCLEMILPLAITQAWDKHIAEFAAAHGHHVGDVFDL